MEFAGFFVMCCRSREGATERGAVVEAGDEKAARVQSVKTECSWWRWAYFHSLLIEGVEVETQGREGKRVFLKLAVASALRVDFRGACLASRHFTQPSTFFYHVELLRPSSPRVSRSCSDLGPRRDALPR